MFMILLRLGWIYFANKQKNILTEWPLLMKTAA